MLEPDLVIKKNKFRRFFPFCKKARPSLSQNLKSLWVQRHILQQKFTDFYRGLEKVPRMAILGLFCGFL
jgi:hypothetical protein